MSVRFSHTNAYGTASPPMVRSLATAVNTTRRLLSKRAHSAGFTTTPPVTTRACPNCELPNPANKSRCRYCGEVLQ